MNGKIATTTGDNDIRKISKAIEDSIFNTVKMLGPFVFSNCLSWRCG